MPRGVYEGNHGRRTLPRPKGRGKEIRTLKITRNFRFTHGGVVCRGGWSEWSCPTVNAILGRGRVFNDGWMALHSDDPPLQTSTHVLWAEDGY
jgi:hypothetical protein